MISVAQDIAQDVMSSLDGINGAVASETDYTARYTFNATGDQGDNSEGTASRDLTLANITEIASGVNGLAVGFDGLTSYATATSVMDTNDVTISLWFKIGTFASESRLVGRRNYPAQSRNFSIRLNTTDGLRFTSDLMQFDGSTDVDDGAWHHAALTYNNTTGVAILYLDNSVEASGTQSGLSLSTYDSGVPMAIGAYYGSDASKGSYFDGNIDELRVYDYVMTSDQISAIYTEEV